jgi:hypothetical protein
MWLALLRQKERPWAMPVQSFLVHLEQRKQRKMLSKPPALRSVRLQVKQRN